MASERQDGFDYLRSLAACGVVLLHASAPYLLHPMPGLVWPVMDERSAVVDWIGWPIEVPIMPIFLAMAGYFAVPAFQRSTGLQFVRTRARRLLVPLLFGLLVILPIDFYVWMLGWLYEGHITPRKIRSLKFDAGQDADLWGLSHLWFLLYLFLYCVCWVLIKRLSGWLPWPRRATDDHASPVDALNSPYPVAWIVLLVGVSWITLAAVPKIVFGFQHDFLPVPSKWLYSGTYFCGGVILGTSSNLRTWLTHRRYFLLALGSIALWFSVRYGTTFLAGDTGLSHRLWMSGASVVAAWSLTLGLHGWALGSTWPARPWVRYFSAASLWIYMVHHPIVALTHIVLKSSFSELHPVGKTMLAAIVGLSFSLLTFETLVRREPLARWLGTPDYLRRSSQAS